ncbi:MAG: acyl-CoA dehydratase activase, partial [Chitinispirillia bacterium]
MKVLGICFGATSIQSVIIQSDPEMQIVVAHKRINHNGNPANTFLRYLDKINIFDIDRIAVTGRRFKYSVNLSSISEPEAVEYALSEVFKNDPPPDAVISCGGETQLVYKIDRNGCIESVLSGNKCASGTGEFFLQQIRRLGLNVTDAARKAAKGKPYQIAGRCSVFCKSDCTHALNKGEPVENIISGLCSMMADKIDSLIKDFPCKKVVVIGGGVLNSALISIIKDRYINTIIPDYASVFEAYGAALWALKNQCIETPLSFSEIIKSVKSSVSFHPPLIEWRNLVEFKNSKKGVFDRNDEFILGLDVGSTTTKAVLMRYSDKRIVSDVYIRTNGDPIEASKKCYSEIHNQLGTADIKIIGLGVTGSGRQIAGLHALTNNIINEIIAHASAASFYDNNVDTIFEIGGQDAKYTFLTGGIPSDYRMNEACSAGTGSFLEESAIETLGVLTEEIGEKALKAHSPPNFSDQCAAFISSDIKRAVQLGISEENILAGLVYSVCMNYINRVKGSYPTGKKIFMQGGVCYNKAVPVAMASLLRTKIIVPPNPGLMGAFGVALETAKRLDTGVIKKQHFKLTNLANRTAHREGSFTCKGGNEKCDRKCTISRIRVNGLIYSFGGVCDKYYNLRIDKKTDNILQLDYVSLRQKLMFDVYGPDESLIKKNKDKKAGTVGFNNSLLIHSLYPLFSNFFNLIGYRTVLSQQINPTGVSRTMAEFCYPVELAHGSFYSLLNKRCNFIFLPQVMQIPVSNVPTYSRLCPFVQGEPYYLKTTFHTEIKKSDSVILSPVVKMGDGYDKGIEAFVTMACKMGVAEKKARHAYIYSCEKQIAFERELFRHGRKALYAIEKNPGTFAIVLFGRPYNSFTSDANMNIPRKVASRGYTIIPHDMLPSDSYSVDKKMFWAMGQKIMKSAQFVKEHEKLFGFYITNFSCGPDSFLLGYFNSVMSGKPSLTLELDQYTADAGIDTRIEAAIDIIKRYRRIAFSPKKNIDTYTPAKVLFPYVFTSSGQKLHIQDQNVEILLPSIGQMASQMAAAVLRKNGFHARALPILTKSALLTGKKNTSCKECLPFINMTGAILDYLNQRKDPEKVSVIVMATGGGPCRLGQYYRGYENIIQKNRIKNAAMFTLTDENGYAGLGTDILLQVWKGILLTDILSDIRSMLKVTAANPGYAMNVLNSSWKKCVAYFEGKLSIRFSSLLRFLSLRIAEIPLKANPHDIPVISLTGEIFVRRDEFSRNNIVDYLESRGFMVRVTPLAEYICYSNYIVNKKLGENKFTVLDQLKFRIVSQVQEWWEKRIKN